MNWIAPAWLAGLLLLPLLRWLHRGGRPRRAIAVSYLPLWRGAALPPPAAGVSAPPDPAWRRRALLAALLLVALAGPQWPLARRAVTIWVDDAPSMAMHEARGTRLESGLAQARAALATLGPAGAVDVEWRALGDPWRELGAAPDAAAFRATATAATAAAPVVPRYAPAPPPAALLRVDRLQWLVSDGAHAQVFDWPAGRQPDRVFEVGRSRRNVAVVRLAARRHGDGAQRIDLLIELVNGGDAPETRELTIASGGASGAAPQRSTWQLDAGQSLTVAATIAGADRVSATLVPGDALPDDDGLSLDLAPLRPRRVAVDPSCPAPLRAAVAAHPGLVQAAAAAAEAALDCGAGGMPPGLPTLRVRAERLPQALGGDLQWSAAVEASARVELDAATLRLAAPLDPADAAVLLAAGAQPLIVEHDAAPRRIETAIDFGAGAGAASAQTPLLVDFLFSRLLRARLLDPIAAVDRGVEAARVVPHHAGAAAAPPALASAPAPAGAPTIPRDATPWVLAAALLVLLWEIAALLRQARRLGAAEPAP